MHPLTIAYSTLAEREGNIRLPEGDQFDYLVIVQKQESDSEKSSTNLKAFREVLQSTGVAKSRNRAIELCKTGYLLFADDDIQFHPSALKQAVDHLEGNQDIDLLLLQAEDENGSLRKRYPTKPENLTRLNSARAATYEMLVRVDRIRKLGVRFDEQFGAGVENYLGDEYIFICDLLGAGGKGQFLPLTIAIHPQTSSGSGWGTDRDRKARAKVFTRVFGWSAPLVRLAFGIRRLNELGGIANLVRFVLAR